jgi:hypothetical protein
MAITASQQAFVHAVAVGLGKIRFPVGVAAVAQVGLLGHEQRSPLFGEMRRMAGDTADAVSSVRRAGEIGMLAVALVAFQAPRADGIRRGTLEDKYLSFVATAINVFRARAMAGFATVRLSPAFKFKDAVPVPRPLHVFEHIFVAGLAGIGANVLGWRGWC